MNDGWPGLSRLPRFRGAEGVRCGTPVHTFLQPCLYKNTDARPAITHVFIVVEAHVGPLPVPGVPGQLAQIRALG